MSFLPQQYVGAVLTKYPNRFAMNVLLINLVEMVTKPFVTMLLFGFCWAIWRTLEEEYLRSSISKSVSLLRLLFKNVVWVIPTLLFLVLIWYGRLYCYSFLV